VVTLDFSFEKMFSLTTLEGSDGLGFLRSETDGRVEIGGNMRDSVAELRPLMHVKVGVTTTELLTTVVVTC